MSKESFSFSNWNNVLLSNETGNSKNNSTSQTNEPVSNLFSFSATTPIPPPTTTFQPIFNFSNTVQDDNPNSSKFQWDIVPSPVSTVTSLVKFDFSIPSTTPNTDGSFRKFEQKEDASSTNTTNLEIEASKAGSSTLDEKSFILEIQAQKKISKQLAEFIKLINSLNAKAAIETDTSIKSLKRAASSQEEKFVETEKLNTSVLPKEEEINTNSSIPESTPQNVSKRVIVKRKLKKQGVDMRFSDLPVEIMLYILEYVPMVYNPLTKLLFQSKLDPTSTTFETIQKMVTANIISEYFGFMKDGNCYLLFPTLIVDYFSTIRINGKSTPINQSFFEDLRKFQFFESKIASLIPHKGLKYLKLGPLKDGGNIYHIQKERNSKMYRLVFASQNKDLQLLVSDETIHYSALISSVGEGGVPCFANSLKVLKIKRCDVSSFVYMFKTFPNLEKLSIEKVADSGDNLSYVVPLEIADNEEYLIHKKLKELTVNFATDTPLPIKCLFRIKTLKKLFIECYNAALEEEKFLETTMDLVEEKKIENPFCNQLEAIQFLTRYHSSFFAPQFITRTFSNLKVLHLNYSASRHHIVVKAIHSQRHLKELGLYFSGNSYESCSFSGFIPTEQELTLFEQLETLILVLSENSAFHSETCNTILRDIMRHSFNKIHKLQLACFYFNEETNNIIMEQVHASPELKLVTCKNCRPETFLLRLASSLNTTDRNVEFILK